MEQWLSRGDILRWWRTEVAELSQRTLADHVGVGRTAVANWENGSRMASVEIDRLDRAMGADGTLSGLLWAFGTPGGLEPGRLWTNVYPGDSTVVWVWLRGEHETVEVEAEWGVFRVEVSEKQGPNGLFITVGASLDESPVILQTRSEGWADFGRGDLPRRVAGAPVLEAVDFMQPGSATGAFVGLVYTNIAEQFVENASREVLELDNSSRRKVESFLDDAGDGKAAKGWTHVGDGLDELERSRFVRMRQCRSISLQETAKRLGELTGTKVSKDTLRRFESGTGEPHDPLLPVALDHVLGGNGHLALTTVSSGRGQGSVRFPPYWRAPVWLSFEGPVDRFDGELHWGNWRRRIDGELPMLLISHSAMTPLRIVVPDEISWTAGVGRRNGATPINQGWVPASHETAKEALMTYQDILRDAIRHAGGHHDADDNPIDEDTGFEDGEAGAG